MLLTAQEALCEEGVAQVAQHVSWRRGRRGGEAEVGEIREGQISLVAEG